MAAMTKEMTIDGPAYSLAARPVRVKIPAPMMTPMPKTVRSRALRRFLSWYSASSVSAIDSSIDLVRKMLMGSLPRSADGRGRGVYSHPALLEP